MRTVTFYSYKGGVGRTLAVANTALRLARLGQKVFTVDFDLEAPGLHHKWDLYPGRGPLRIERGLVDFLHDYVAYDRLPRTLEGHVLDVTEPGGKAASIFFMPAGRAPSPGYAEQLARLDWHDLFYTEHGEGVPLFLDLKDRIREEFAPDVLLIDARTGLTEMGGVATSLLADQVFGMTLRHHEHLEGTRAVLRGLRRVPRLEGDAPVRAEAILARFPRTIHFAAVEQEKRRVRAYLNELAERLEDTLAIRDVLVIRADPRLEIDERLMLGGLEPELPLLHDYLGIVRRILGPDEVEPEEETIVHAPPNLIGPLPHNLPPRRLFVGRTQELQRIDEALQREGRTSIAQAVLWSLGGVGKTALALEYAYGALGAGKYPGGIFWVLAEGSPVDVMFRLAGILRQHAPSILNDLPAHTPPAEVAEGVRRALANLPASSLIVLDNVSERGLAELLPGGEVTVLLTTRDRRLGVGKPVELDVLSPEDARALAIDLAGAPATEAEGEALRRVLEEQLGRLAVAVEVAARAVREWARSWVEYEKLLATQPREALDAEEDRSPNYEKGVFATLDLSIDHCDENARELLEGAAIFAPDAVPRDWVYASAGLDPESISAKRALEELEALRLVKVDDEAGTLSMHRLIHKRVRDRAAAEARSAAGTRAVELVWSWIKSAAGPAKEQMDAVEARREHIMEALAAAERVGSMQMWSFIANELALHLQNRAEYSEARSFFERALAIDEKTYGPEHPEVATLLSNLALVLSDLGEPAQARALVERALAIDEERYGPEHPKVAIQLSNLAGVLQDLGKPAEARVLAERALAIDEKTYGPEHPNVATPLSNLATVLKDLGEPARARPLVERALVIDERTYGPEHPNVAIRLSNLAAVLQDLGEPAQARPLLERALAIAEKALPLGHPMRATIAENLASL